MRIGEVWRKPGPCDWVKVVSFEFQGQGSPCVRVRFSNHNGNFKRMVWAWPAKDYDQFVKDMEKHHRYLVIENA